MATDPGKVGVAPKPPRPISTTSSQLSISDRMTDGDEEDIRLPTTTASSASSEVDAPHPPPVPQSGSGSAPPQGQLDEVTSRPLSRVSLGHARTTTISTIAMESNTSPVGSGSKCSPTRLVIALLQTPHRGLQLKVIELSPPLLKLPDSLQDAEDFLRNHCQCIKNLQSKQSPVEELLRQADNLIATQKPRAEVYAAMADSLGQTWKDLNAILEERRGILQLAMDAHGNISSCLQKMDQVHAYYSRLSYLGGMRIHLEGEEEEEGQLQGHHEKDEQGHEDAQAKLIRLRSDRADILRSVATCLESCDALLVKIGDYNYTIDSRELVLVKDVEFATRQVHRWLERLHDRRVILEDRLRNKREELEEFADNSKFHQEIQSLVQELEEYSQFSNQFNFGDSFPSAEARGTALALVLVQLKILQEKALSTAKRLEDCESGARARFSQRFGLKNRIYEILSQTNDLLTLSLDLEPSVGDAKEFFRLGEMADTKLESFSQSCDPNPDSEGRAELNQSIQDALNKAQTLLQGWGWDSPKTKGIRALYDSLLERKNALSEQLQHLAVLDEYNDFLESVNQTYQNILNIETSSIRQPLVVPPGPVDAVTEFTSLEERTLTQVRNNLGMETLTSKLEKIYPDLSEEEKRASEGKINSLKSLSNVIQSLLQARVGLGQGWAKVLEIYGGGGEDIGKDLAQIRSIFQDELKPLLEEIHSSDPDLITGKMEAEVGRILKELEAQGETLQMNERVRDICQKYKVKLDHHLLGDGSGSGGQRSPQYYPVLSRDAVNTAFQPQGQPEVSKVTALQSIIHDVIRPKLENTLVHFFQPLLTSYRQEILDISDPRSPKGHKTKEESDFERYCDRLKESYVTVTAQIEAYLGDVLGVCRQVEERLATRGDTTGAGAPRSVEELQNNLANFEAFRSEISERIQREVGPKLDHLLETIRHEEPPEQGSQEMESLRQMMARLGHDQELDTYREGLRVELREVVVQNDLDLISTQLQHLIQELEQPTNYGNCYTDANSNLENYQRFEQTVEKLRVKLTEMLGTAGIPESDPQVGRVRRQLETLKEKRNTRKNLILHSLEYFRLIEESHIHYTSVNRYLDMIRAASETERITIPEIETLLKEVQDVKKKEGGQEGRLKEIERISSIIFADNAQPTHQSPHRPLRQQNADVTGELNRVEEKLAKLLETTKVRSAALADILEKKEKDAAEAALLDSKGQSQGQGRPISPLPPVTSSTVEIQELTHTQTLEVVSSSTIRRSLSPVPQQPLTSTSMTSTLEKETQFETGEEGPKPINIDRDTLTQTVAGRMTSSQTEDPVPSDGPRPLSRARIDPAFVQPLKDVVVNEGDQVVLEAGATGQIHHVTWFKDGVELGNNSFSDYVTELVTTQGGEQGDGMTLTLTKARLSIAHVSGDNGGIFTVRGTGGENNSVVVETSGTLRVREPTEPGLQAPVFLSHPPISVGPHGQGHTLELRVEGNPLPTVQWFKNGLCIDTSPDYIITFNNGLCRLQWDELLKELDEGIYSCAATNKLGEVETHVQLQVRGGEGLKKTGGDAKQGPKILRPLPKTVNIPAGEGLRLEVEYESPTEVNVLWFKDDNKVLTTANCSGQMRTIGSVASLAFNSTSPGVSGKYRVLLRNSCGEVQSECLVRVGGLPPSNASLPDPEPQRQPPSALNPDLVDLLEGIEIKAPLLKMSLKDASDVIIGQSLKLDCVIVGQPEPEVIWYRNSSPIKESPNHHLVFSGDRCSLLIKSLNPGDAGEYSVLAVNPGGQISSKCQVILKPQTPPPSRVENPEEKAAEVKEDAKVKMIEKNPENVSKNGGGGVEISEISERPSFKRIIQDEMITAGDRFEFVVELESDCDTGTEVTWFKNNKRLEAGEGVELSCDPSSRRYSLLFNEVKLSDKGNYLAKASNSGGDAKCFACLIVKENLEFPQKSGSGSGSGASGDGSVWQQKTVTTPESEKPPPFRSVVANKPARFLVPLEGRMVDEGEYNVTLKCVVEANPAAVLKWTKNNAVASILPSPNLEQRYIGRTGEVELLLKKVTISDAGRYCCTATNDFGLATSVCDLVVKKIAFPPVFSKRLQSLGLEEGKRLYLEVDVYGKPPPEIGWFLNGVKLWSGGEAGDFLLRSDTPTRHSLVLGKVESGVHDGEYLVMAKNEAGEASSSCRVKIIPGGVRTVPILKSPPPPVPPKPKIPPPTPSPEPDSRFNVPSLSRLITDLPPAPHPPLVTSTSTSTSISSIRQMSTFETRSAHLPPPMSPPPTTTTTGLEDLEPGPRPQILFAPSPTSDWSRSGERKTQLQEKVKNFEVRSETPDLTSPPSGGVRLIPIKESPTKEVNAKVKVVDLPILPLTPFPASTGLPASSILLGDGDRKPYFDSGWSTSKETTTLPGGGVTSTESKEFSSFSKSETGITLIKPSKFVPSQMRESDYDSSDVEGGVIPVKWTPRGSPMSPPPHTPTTTSAFASCKPGGGGGGTTSLFSSQQSSSSFQSTTMSSAAPFPTFVKPTVPPKPRNLSMSPLPQGGSPGCTPEKVRNLVKSWPPQEQGDSMDQGQSSGHPPPGLLSPRPLTDYRSARSPTPSKEALEMDKLWSRPIRFASPTKMSSGTSGGGFGSPITSPPMSPRPGGTEYYTSFPSPTPPKPPAKPSWAPSSQRDRGGYMTPIEVTSPLPPGQGHENQGPMSPRDRGEPVYYVSVVSTPRTTPIPGPFSPERELAPGPFSSAGEPISTLRNFQEKKSFFEQQLQSSSSSYSTTMEERSFHQTSSSFVKNTATTPGLGLDSSIFLPPPGETPEFLYAAPPQRRQEQPKKTTSTSTSTPTTPGGGVSSIRTEQFSSSSMTTSTFSKTFTSSGDGDKQVPARPHRVQILQHEIRVTPPTPPGPEPSMSMSTTTPTSTLIPYIKPSVFTPQLDFASSLEHHPSTSETVFDQIIPPTWNPEGTVLTTTWKRVSYAPRGGHSGRGSCQSHPHPEWRKSDPSGTLRNPLTLLVEERMKDLNAKFKDNIALMGRGLGYNKLDRKIGSSLEPVASTQDLGSNKTLEANPLIYFKYDFGYEFGIADPQRVIVRGASEPRENFGVPAIQGGGGGGESWSTDKVKGQGHDGVSYVVDETGVIHLPIIHEKTGGASK